MTKTISKTDDRKVKFVFLVLPNTNLTDFAGAAQVFSEAIEMGLNAEIEYCAFEKNIITSSKLPLSDLPDFKNIRLEPGDYLFVVSAHIDYILSKKSNPSNDLKKWLNQQYENKIMLCALCNGAFILGKAGLLDFKLCTTHWKRTKELKKMFPVADVQENILYIEDKGVITSAGAASGIDVAMHILKKISSDHFALKVARELIVYTRRSGSSPQQSAFLNHRNHINNGIHKVQDWLEENLKQSPNIPQLADLAGMSERNFTRIFKKVTHLTVNEYITLLRKEKIKYYIEESNFSRRQIAYECGLKSERQLSRIINVN